MTKRSQVAKDLFKEDIKDNFQVIGINTGTGEFINAPKSFEITHVDLVERND